PARILATSLVQSTAAGAGAGRALLRRHDERIWRDANLCRSDSSNRSLGNRRIYSRAAAQPARAHRRCPGGGSHSAGAAAVNRQLAAAAVPGLIGLLLTALLGIADPPAAFRSYLMVYTLWLGLGVGCLGIAFVQFM